MFPKCYLDYMNSGYRAMPQMPSPAIFPGGMGPGGFTQGSMQGSQGLPMEDTMQDTDMGSGVNIIPGGTSSGAPTPGGTPGPTPPAMPVPGVGVTLPSPFETAPGAPVTLDGQYTQGYLRTQIGKRVRVTFLLGTSTLQDRVGILKSVGISYIIITDPSTNTDILGDIYSIKFVDIFPPSPVPVPGIT